MVTPDMVLSRLPPYMGEVRLIKKEQYVPDIIKEVSAAHRLFGEYYDEFSDLFYDRDPGIVADRLYHFCKKYLVYKEESKDRQTTALPTAILNMGYVTGEGVDCKHYALFCAGVIGSLNRLYNCCFEACYYFVGYGGAKEPYHVYVSVLDSDRDHEIWIDPTPGSGGTPSLIIPKPL